MDTSLVILALSAITDASDPLRSVVPFGNVGLASLSISRDCLVTSANRNQFCVATIRNLFEDYVTSPSGRDILWVIAAGNGDVPLECDLALSQSPRRKLYYNQPSQMACDNENVVSVGGLNPDTNVGASQNYSLVGATTISAPGQQVWLPSGPGGYEFASGTSFGTPLVAGAAALLLSMDPTLEPRSLKQILVETSQPTKENTDFDPSIPPQPGLDMLAAVQFVDGVSCGGPSICGKGIKEDSSVVPFLARPALSGFSFDFIGESRELGFIRALLAEQTVSMKYGRESVDAEYNWTIDRRSMPVGTTIHTAIIVADGSETGVFSMGPIGDTVPAIVGFDIDGGNSHNIQGFGVSLGMNFGMGEIVVSWHDASAGGDQFVARIDYALIPEDAVDDFGSVGRGGFGVPGEGGPIEGGETRAITAIKPVLRSFNFQFDNGSHQIDEIAARIQPGLATVKFNDSGDNDPFHYSISWWDLK